ncbi:TadE/TadG family type IV pilus assembly protein [Catenuloplanes atrovinosus]|uniref:Flp pilus assembly protein TadG n=1 Tax=Catenuloplanes atrovinosus TaxID=137266 RepID=A0AAE3YUV5_9ACTN|nr:TadE/TadG family type IV pilus assembly protein [Catenuloplanes atrovinosus]MDR7278859.1 Flp pilus assembly protein TadG [Catenuloplanes atrovinosus]
MIRRRDRGSVSVEVAILTPAFIALIVTAFVVGRTATATNAVDLAAHDAARAASIARDAASADTAARAAAEKALAQQDVTCTNSNVISYGTPNSLLGAFATPVGQPASVVVTVTCVISFADLGFPGVPGDRTKQATYESVLDTYRSRS